MTRLAPAIAALLIASFARAALAQSPETAVEVVALAAPDAFSTSGRETGLPKDLWRGASVKTAKTVLSLLAVKTLTPAGAALARRVLATGATGPKAADDDETLTGARASALMAQGDVRAASVILARAPGVDRNPDLARAVAESALLSGDDPRACATAQGLSSGRDDIYWLRLRAYCQVIGGHADQAELTFDLAQSQAKDAVFGRLMSAKIAGAGDPGAASLRNGLDLALSRNLGLDLTLAKAAPRVAAALITADPAPPVFDPTGAPAAVAPFAELLSRGDPVPYTMVQGLIDIAASADPKARAHGQAALLLAAGLAGPLSADLRGEIASLAVADGKAPLGRSVALESAGDQKLMGEAALLSLWICADAGPAGPALGDRIRIVRALNSAGLTADARAFALEGLLSLK